jgi:hypothetical protein
MQLARLEMLVGKSHREPERAGRRPQWVWRCVAVVGAGVMPLGCGSESNTAHLQGQVTIGGLPIPADAIGSVTFQTTKGGQGRTASAPIESGKYDSPDTPVGAVKVFITVQQPTGRTIDNGRGTPAPEYKNIISIEYSSGIDLQVDGDNAQQDFDLKPS